MREANEDDATQVIKEEVRIHVKVSRKMATKSNTEWSKSGNESQTCFPEVVSRSSRATTATARFRLPSTLYE